MDGVDMDIAISVDSLDSNLIKSLIVEDSSIIEGNEEAGLLAKQGSERHPSRTSKIPIPFREVRSDRKRY